MVRTWRHRWEADRRAACGRVRGSQGEKGPKQKTSFQRQILLRLEQHRWTVKVSAGGDRRDTMEATHVFGENLLKRLTQEMPIEHLEVLLNVPGLGIRELHDTLKEFSKTGLVLGNRGRAEALEIASDTVLLLDGKLAVRQTLEEVDDVDGCDKARVGFLTVYARDDGINFAIVLLPNGLARHD